MKLVIIFIVAEAILFPLAIIWTIQAPGPFSTSALVAITILAIIGITATALKGLWNPLADKYPAVEPGPDGVSKKFQSFSYGIVNLGFSIHVTADTDHLHLTPIRFMRIFGARSASIPWSEMEPIKESRRKARVNGQVLQGPKWCMELANPSMENEG